MKTRSGLRGMSVARLREGLRYRPDNLVYVYVG